MISTNHDSNRVHTLKRVAFNLQITFMDQTEFHGDIRVIARDIKKRNMLRSRHETGAIAIGYGLRSVDDGIDGEGNLEKGLR